MGISDLSDEDGAVIFGKQEEKTAGIRRDPFEIQAVSPMASARR